ncbi:MAG: DMT family transporter [Acidobacteriaceae bacterium]|jgi:drug/metabolite transporter (DMT)-like permease
MTTVASSPKISRNTLAHLLMFAMVMLWGTMFVLLKEAFAHIEPQWFNALRMTIAFLCLAIVYRAQWRRLTRAAWVAGAAAGATMAVGFFFQAQGLLYTTATNSALLTAMVVVMVPFLVSVPGVRPPGAALPPATAWFGAVLAFVGVALLTTPAHTPWMHLLKNLNRGDLLSLLCALGFALQIIALDRGAKRVGFEQLTLLQVAFAMVFLTVGALVTEPPRHDAIAHLLAPGSPLINPLVVFAVVVAGLFATALAFGVQTWAQQVIPATNIAVIVTLEPVFAWITAFVVLHERLHLRGALGAALVLTGILVTELLPRAMRRKQRV